MRSYPQITEQRALYELPMNRGFALIAAVQHANPFLELDGPGYLGLELDGKE